MSIAEEFLKLRRRYGTTPPRLPASRTRRTQIATRTNVSAFVPDYRLAPEHVFPAAVDDAKAAYQGLAERGAKTIAIVGDSAGGGLALVHLSITNAEAGKRDGTVLCAGAAISPWTDLALTAFKMSREPGSWPPAR